MSDFQRRLASHWRQAVLVLLGLALLTLLLSMDAPNELLHRVLAAAEPVIAAHPLIGGVVFLVLSAASAMLAFFSSALLVPVAVYAWGKGLTIALLWLGWWLGGVSAYWVGRLFRRPLVHSKRAAKLVDFYADKVPAQAHFPVVLLLQFALPSEVPGYLCGLLGVRFRIYAGALAIAEVPYAVGTVLAGESVVQRQGWWLVVLGVIAVLLSLFAAYRLHKALRR